MERRKRKKVEKKKENGRSPPVSKNSSVRSEPRERCPIYRTTVKPKVEEDENEHDIMYKIQGASKVGKESRKKETYFNRAVLD